MNEDRVKEQKINQKTDGKKVPWVEGSNIMIDPWTPNEEKGENSPSVKDIRDALAAEAEKLTLGKEKWQPSWKTLGEVATLTPRDGSRLVDSDKERNE